MTLQLETDQIAVLREILQSTMQQLRIESARTDAHDYRELLHERERVVETVLSQLGKA